MANVVYPTFKARLLSPGIDLVAGLIGAGASSNPTPAPLKAALVATGAGGYAYDPAHATLADVSGHVIGTAQAIAGAAVAGSSIDADDVDFPDVAEGSTVGAIVLYMDTGTAATSPLVAYFDTIPDGETTIPMAIVTNGRSILFRWSAGALRIFGL